MLIAAAVQSTSSTKAMWYLTRGSGLVALLLLTATLVIGVMEWRRWTPRTWPRFVVDAIHRYASLLAVALIAVHVVTSLLDGFAPISIVDVFVPFGGTYRPFWLGLGALALDLMLAIAITSALRLRMGHRAWRAVHWLAYACWPVALMHSIGTGSDTKASWALGLSAICLVAVVIAVWARALVGWPDRAGLRGTAMAASIAGPLALALWLPSGPLGQGWARRSGTPASLLGTTVVGPARRGGVRAPASAATSPATPSALRAPFSASLDGTATQGQGRNAQEVAIELDLKLSGGRRMVVILNGLPLPTGGLSLTASRVTLGTAGRPRLFSGRVTSLTGSHLQTALFRPRTRPLLVSLDVSIDSSTGTVTGTASAAAGAA